MPGEDEGLDHALKLLEREREKREAAASTNTTLEFRRRQREVARCLQDLAKQLRDRIRRARES